jgi:hypothetical protein
VSTSETNQDRIRAAGIDPAGLSWFLAMATQSDLDQLPAEALYLPGQRTNNRETYLDLATGRPVYIPEPVASGKVFCLLAPLKPLMRTESATKPA